MRTLETLLQATVVALLAIGCDAGQGADGGGVIPSSDASASTDTSAALDSAIGSSPVDTGSEAEDTRVDTLMADTSEAATDTSDAADDTTGLDGRYAQLQVQSSINDVPFVGDTVATTQTHLLVDIVWDGAKYLVTQTVCDVTLDSGTELVSTILPDAAVAAIGTSELSATLDGDTFETTRNTDVWGAVLANPVTDALPTEPTDARVVDHESDGKPGMTVRVTGLVDGEIYVVQRGWTTLRGQRDGADRIDGLIDWGQDQVVLDADNALLKVPIEGVPNADASASWFRSTRVDSGMGCTELLAQSETLFGR